MNEIAVSTYPMDITELTSELYRVQNADYIHADVMDGEFVTNTTFDEEVVADINEETELPIEAHLMITNPGEHVTKYINAGADIITFHIEATDDAHHVMQTIHDHGANAGIAINPDTPVNAVTDHVNTADHILVMSVQPGEGGQTFIPETTETIKTLNEYKDTTIAVDGGINETTGEQCVQAGADILVSGSYIHNHNNPTIAIDILRNL